VGYILLFECNAVLMEAKPVKSPTNMGTLFLLSKSATATALDISEVALLLFGVLLVIGLIGEYAKAERWKKHLKLFEMFVIIGVAGELLADGGIFLFSRHLQTIADLEIAELTREAGNARTSAESAASAASNATTSAHEAGVEAEKAQQRVRELAKQADELQNEVIAANGRVEQLRKANNESAANLELEKNKRVHLAASLLDRRFADQSGAIATLSGLPPMQAVFEFPDEREPRRMAEQINFVLTDLNWTTWRRRGNESTIQDGITISTGMVGIVELPKETPESERKGLAQRILNISSELSDCLKRSGIDAQYESEPFAIRGDLTATTVLIRVGYKPNTVVEETLRELGPQPQPTPLRGNAGNSVLVAPGGIVRFGGNRTHIGEQKPESKKP
jgi:hypothetical protein